MSYKNKNLFVSKFIIKNYRQINVLEKLNVEAKITDSRKGAHKLTTILLKTLLNTTPKLNLKETRASQMWIVNSTKYKNCLSFIAWIKKNINRIDTTSNPFKLRNNLNSQSLILKGCTSKKFDFILDALNLELNTYNLKINVVFKNINFVQLRFVFNALDLNIE